MVAARCRSKIAAGRRSHRDAAPTRSANPKRQIHRWEARPRADGRGDAPEDCGGGAAPTGMPLPPGRPIPRGEFTGGRPASGRRSYLVGGPPRADGHGKAQSRRGRRSHHRAEDRGEGAAPTGMPLPPGRPIPRGQFTGGRPALGPMVISGGRPASGRRAFPVGGPPSGRYSSRRGRRFHHRTEDRGGGAAPTRYGDAVGGRPALGPMVAAMRRKIAAGAPLPQGCRSHQVGQSQEVNSPVGGPPRAEGRGEGAAHRGCCSHKTDFPSAIRH
jgi:hypothetical protein